MVKVKTDNALALYDRDVPPSLVPQVVVLLLQVVVVVVVVLLLMLDLNLALLLADLVMMDLEDPAMMHLEDLAMMHQEDLVMMHREGLVMMLKRDLVMMHREGQLMMGREDRFMMHPGALTMMHLPELPLAPMDRCHPEIMFLMGLQHHLHVQEVGMRQHHEVETLLGDEQEIFQCLLFDQWTYPSFSFVFFPSSKALHTKSFL